MHHSTPLLTTLVAALTAALLLGVLARRLRLPPLVGYLLAGMLIGPNTPGFVGDLALASELSEIGIILLMFGVGLHFSPKELAEARGVAVPGALAQMAAATVLGWGVARLFGWSDGQGFVFGICLSVASTVVLLRALQERGEMTSNAGKIAVGWLVVEDLAMVIALVLVPVGAALLDGRTPAGMLSGMGVGGGDLVLSLLVTLGKVAVFVALMLVVGSRVMPAALSMVGALRSRELFSLAALVAALGVAYVASVAFGVSFALGAFLSGLVLGQSALSQKAAEQTLPLRDAFAVVFFVSVGMLFDPAILLAQPALLAGAVLVVMLGKSAAAWGIARIRGLSNREALLIAASLSQIGEFSFILAGIGVAERVLPPQGRDLVLAVALITIALNPVMFWLADRLAAPPQPVPAPAPAAASATAPASHGG
ncbi:cation:proton antiporter domain-containing protein [Paracraurococcus ruber]|uniref:Potassium transporter Kef n=1 Tax=Paracraurococcus ruber TaxID=77675 RepID=A0ABS1D4K4_9PROT|nr:cation:proton antiporter [Paracraurococcus ruber]MBK1661800.1 potassium transporter Kef [Paracraurococcus ruber]TDG17843.1 potassium transporter Kef [Paracraurococcus ruber]